MARRFKIHTGFATAVLFIVGCLAVAAVYGVANGHTIKAAGIALAAYRLWLPIKPAITGEQPASKRTRDG